MIVFSEFSKTVRIDSPIKLSQISTFLLNKSIKASKLVYQLKTILLVLLWNEC